MFVIGLVLAFASVAYTKRLWGCWFNPMALFLAMWSSLFAIYSLDLLPYYELQFRTYVVLLASGICFCAGCGAASLCFLRNRVRQPTGRLRTQINLAKLRRLTYALYFAGVMLLVGFLFAVQSRFSLLQIINEPWHLRAALPEGEFGWYLRFFYFTMPAAVLAFLHLRFSRTHKWTMHLIVWSSLAFGVATTGRTAVVWLLMWLACAYVFLAEREGKELRALGVVALSSVSAFLIFNVFGNWVGRTYENSPFTTTKNVSDTFSFVVVPYYYFTSNLPAFQNLIVEPPEWALGSHTFLPLLKVIGSAVDVQAPAEVSEFTSTPYLANTYTYLAPYYEDFGLFGVFAFPALLGFLVGYMFFEMRFRGMNLTLLFTNSLLATVIIFSVAVNRLISSPTWWFLALAPIAGRLCAQRQPMHLRLWNRFEADG
jgi:oligosaccharide repeat unit polymerase